VLNENTGAKINGVTDANGQFRTSGLPDGSYEVTIESLGFRSFKQSAVSVHGYVPMNLKVELATDFVGEVVTIDHRSAFRKFISKLRHIF
jgi:hypothetical protein